MFIEQGYGIQVLEGEQPDLILAPFAQRMTGDMLLQLPAALRLAIQGARALRYAPHGVILGKGKKGVQGKKTYKRKNPKVQTEAAGGGQPPVDTGELRPQGEAQGVGGATEVPVSEGPHTQ